MTHEEIQAFVERKPARFVVKTMHGKEASLKRVLSIDAKNDNLYCADMHDEIRRFAISTISEIKPQENVRLVDRLEDAVNGGFSAIINFQLVKIKGCPTLSMLLQTMIIVGIIVFGEWFIFSSLHAYDPVHWKK